MGEHSTNGPVASNYVFVSQLNHQQLNAKVRFLACVVEYDESTGCLVVEHKYPRSTAAEICTRASVDANLVLENLQRDLLQSGSWINVIGYLQEKGLSRRRHSRSSSPGTDKLRPTMPRVQAVLVWGAGIIKVEDYEYVVEQHQRLATK